MLLVAVIRLDWLVVALLMRVCICVVANSFTRRVAVMGGRPVWQASRVRDQAQRTFVVFLACCCCCCCCYPPFDRHTLYLLFEVLFC